MPGFRGTLHEYKTGTLHSGSKRGPLVKSRAQALAIAFSLEHKAGAEHRVVRSRASRKKRR